MTTTWGRACAGREGEARRAAAARGKRRLEGEKEPARGGKRRRPEGEREPQHDRGASTWEAVHGAGRREAEEEDVEFTILAVPLKRGPVSKWVNQWQSRLLKVRLAGDADPPA